MADGSCSECCFCCCIISLAYTFEYLDDIYQRVKRAFGVSRRHSGVTKLPKVKRPRMRRALTAPLPEPPRSRVMFDCYRKGRGTVVQRSSALMGCLPIEVRLQIYDYALVSMLVGPLHLNVDHKTRCLVKAQDAAVYPRGALNGWHGPVNLLAMAFTCRQGYTEYLPRLLSHSRLELILLDTNSIARLVEQLPPHHLPWLRNLTVTSGRLCRLPQYEHPQVYRHWIELWHFYARHLRDVRQLTVKHAEAIRRNDLYWQLPLDDDQILSESQWLLPMLEAPMHVKLQLNLRSLLPRLLGPSQVVEYSIDVRAIKEDASRQLLREGNGGSPSQELVVKRVCRLVHAELTGVPPVVSAGS